MKTNYRAFLIVAVFAITLFTAAVNAQGPKISEGASRLDSAEVNLAPDDDLIAGLRWRNIGPFHGGRIAAVTGAIGQPGVFYIGAPAGGIWKTTSAGVTWFPIFDQFTNVDSIGAIQVAPSDANIVYVGTGDSVQGSLGDGMYKSIDAGKTWTHIGLEETVKINRIVIDPKDPDLVLVSTQGDAQHSGRGIYRSTDGGKTFSAFKGAPGGEDPHEIWIDPTNGQRMLFGFDQGPAVTLDGGQTWSGYYQIPIDQIYHIATDNRYPYWVMGSQQDTGAVMTRSRSDWGQITVVDWLPLPSSEFGTVVPDPLRPTTVYGVGYGAGQGNGLIKIDLATGQWGNVAPNFGNDRNLYTEGRDFWKRFDTAFEPKALYVGYNCILVTRDGAQTWKAFSPDLTTPKGQPLAPCGVAPAAAAAPTAGAPTPSPTPAAPAGPRGGLPGSISDFSLSTVKQGVVWSGSSTGQIYNTMDGGKTWNNVTNFTDLPANANFVTVEAGHGDINTAYVLANLGFGRGGPPAGPEQHYIYRTHDGGKTWTRIVSGLPVDERTGSQVHVIREDPKQKGLLFAGTETTVYVSFNDGDHWQSLRLNLPSTSIRDMVFHTDDHMNDLVIGTYGRGFWVLDDMSPLRDIAAKAQEIAAAPAYLFKPGDAIRARMSANWDQPMNPEMPHAPNPPFGALIYYHLSRKPAGEIKLQFFDAANKLVRTITSTPPPPATERPPYPGYWLMPPSERALSTNVGTNRINWNLRYDDPPGYNPDINNQMNSAPGQVTPAPHGPLALPGTYTVKLLVDGATYTQTLVVHNDPRVGESPGVMSGLRAQNKLATAAVQGMKDSYAANQEVAAVRAQLAAIARGSLPAEVATAATALDTKLATIGGARAPGRGGGGGGFGGPARVPGSVLTFTAINALYNTVLAPLTQNGLDMPPTKAEVDTLESGCKEFTGTLNAWKTMLGVDLIAFNSLLSKNNLAPLKITPTAMAAPASCTFVWPAATTRGGK